MAKSAEVVLFNRREGCTAITQSLLDRNDSGMVCSPRIFL